MENPSKLLVKLTEQLFTGDRDRENFTRAIVSPPNYYKSIIWCRPKPENLPFAIAPPLSWQPSFSDRVPPDIKLGSTPLHDRGFFYCLDFSSIFAASVLLAIPQPVGRVFDVCAAPGGKSIFAWQALKPELLLGNEIIGKRIGMLYANLKRCQIVPSIIFSLDSQKLAQLIPKSMPVVLVDAPCSGQSLIAKGLKAPGCFHPVTVRKNASRQKRILANSAQLVAPQGYLAYMTCTYAPQENEMVIDWFLQKFTNFKPVIVPHLLPFQSPLTDIASYRMFPQSGLGAGAFTCLLQNSELGERKSLPTYFLEGCYHKIIPKN